MKFQWSPRLKRVIFEKAGLHAPKWLSHLLWYEIQTQKQLHTPVHSDTALFGLGPANNTMHQGTQEESSPLCLR